MILSTIILFLAACVRATEVCEDILKPPNNDTGLVSCAYNVINSVANTSSPLFFNWTTPFPPSSVVRRCQCALVVMNLIADNGHDLSSLCNTTADVYCTNYCYTNTNGQCNAANSCATSHESVDLCAVYRTEKREYQVLVIYGLSCNTLVTHTQLVCDSLRNIDGNDYDNKNDPIVLLLFAVGVTQFCALIILTVVVITYCIYQRYRKWKTSFSHDNPTRDTVQCHMVTEILQHENLAYQYSPTVELEMSKCATYDAAPQVTPDTPQYETIHEYM